MNPESSNFSLKDILIVDDTSDNLRYLSILLSEKGYKVRKALNGKQALKACKTILPDLILLDIRMPELDGYEVCQRLKAWDLTCKIPVIFLSALDDVFDKVKAFEVGGVDYITKPFKAEEVLVRIQNQLALRVAEQRIIALNSELELRVQERTQQLKITNEELLQEIYERQQLQEQLLYLALHDPLTGLANRTLFMKHLEGAIARIQNRFDGQLAVLFLDCDRFKVINDSLGHLVGDELLIAIARRLESILRSGDILARLGGDEFAIFLDNISEPAVALEIANNILNLLSNPFQLSRHEVFINASIGIAFSQSGDNKPEYLLRDADTAMYRAKALGRGRYHVFDPQMHQQALERLEVETDLWRAIERQEFVVYYQPIIALNSGQMIGFETLVRWQHPIKGLIPPIKFISVAEETGLITEIDLWVLREASRQLSFWQNQGVATQEFSLSVNLSPRHFFQTQFIENLDKILSEFPLKGQNIKLEITENAIMEHGESALKILQGLRERNLEVCLDDFGTGYSSLSYLDNFPVNGLKIDQSFIKRMDGSSQQMGLVPAIISIARTMGMSVTAEGIETPAQLELLRMLNCDWGQGYLFSQPVESAVATTLLKPRHQW